MDGYAGLPTGASGKSAVCTRSDISNSVRAAKAARLFLSHSQSFDVMLPSDTSRRSIPVSPAPCSAADKEFPANSSVCPSDVIMRTAMDDAAFITVVPMSRTPMIIHTSRIEKKRRPTPFKYLFLHIISLPLIIIKITYIILYDT